MIQKSLQTTLNTFDQPRHTAQGLVVHRLIFSYFFRAALIFQRAYEYFTAFGEFGFFAFYQSFLLNILLIVLYYQYNLLIILFLLY